MRSLRTLPTIFNCFKYSTYVVVKPDGVSWSAYIHTWCLENQIPQSQFFYWKRKFNQEVPEQPQFAEICFSDQENDMTHEENNYVFRVSYKGMEVAVSSLATVSQITDLITALRRSC